MIRRFFQSVIIFACIAVFFQACGYRLARPSNPLIENIHTIAIPYFKNDTFEPELETLFTHSFVDEFVESRRLQVVGVEEAEVILRGHILQFREETLAYNIEGKAFEYRMIITMDVILEDRLTGKVVWKRNKIIHGEEYSVGNSIVATETAKRRKIKIFAEDIAERVHDSIMQGF